MHKNIFLSARYVIAVFFLKFLPPGLGPAWRAQTQTPQSGARWLLPGVVIHVGARPRFDSRAVANNICPRQRPQIPAFQLHREKKIKTSVPQLKRDHNKVSEIYPPKT